MLQYVQYLYFVIRKLAKNAFMKMSGYLTDFFTFLFFNVSCALKKGPKIPKKLSKKKTLQKDDQDKDDYILPF